MAALTAVVPTIGGTLDAASAVAASDTVTAAQLGQRGALLTVINAGAGTDTITISDAGTTGAGNALASGAVAGLSVANAGVSKVFLLSPLQVNPATGLVTITHSQPTGVTYRLYTLP